MRFESTIAACRAYPAMPLQINGTLEELRGALIGATGAMRFHVRGHDRRVTIGATGELIGYLVP